MEYYGYIDFHGIDCVYFEKNNQIVIVPKDPEKFKEIVKYRNAENFQLLYARNIEKYCSALIDKCYITSNNSFQLIKKYQFAKITDEPINSIIITGEAIDDFFNPARYFYEINARDKADISDVVYDAKEADEWVISIEENDVRITLSYGHILRDGIMSDLMLHPKLTLSFSPTNDIDYLYRLYRTVKRFLQLTLYKLNIGDLNIELLTTYDNNSSYLGELIDYETPDTEYHKNYSEINYNNYRPYIKNLFQFSANNMTITLSNLPENFIRISSRNYSRKILTELFSVFENECDMNKDLYQPVDTSLIELVKKKVIEQIDLIDRHSLSDIEQQFLKDSKNKVQQLGTQSGQSRKIKTAYSVLSKALDSSINVVFHKCELGRGKNHFCDNDIGKIAKEITSLRGKGVHTSINNDFTDREAEMIHFFEIMVYSQMLKRAQINDEGIEFIIGIVFQCNFEFSKKLYNYS